MSEMHAPIPRRRSISGRLLGFYLLSHPVPVLFHIIAVSIFTFLAAWPNFAWNIIVLVIAAHAAMQVSIAMINDYCDRRLDAIGKPQKPIPRGLVQPHEALLGGFLLVLVMLLLLLPLNRLALVVSLCYLLLAQGYNLGLKSTPLSGVVFALAMPLIPLYAFAGMGLTPPLIFWLVPVGFLPGIALNLANALIDIDEDAAYGARTLAVVLGTRRSFALCHGLIGASIVAIALLAIFRLFPAQPLILMVTLATTGLATLLLVPGFGQSKPYETRKLHFNITALICMVLAGGWLLAVLLR